MRPELNDPDEFSMETLDQIPLEEKLIASREEDDYEEVLELTPGEISGIVKNAMVKGLREVGDISDEGLEAVAEVCTEVAYAVMGQITED